MDFLRHYNGIYFDFYCLLSRFNSPCYIIGHSIRSPSGDEYVEDSNVPFDQYMADMERYIRYFDRYIRSIGIYYDLDEAIHHLLYHFYKNNTWRSPFNHFYYVLQDILKKHKVKYDHIVRKYKMTSRWNVLFNWYNIPHRFIDPRNYDYVSKLDDWSGGDDFKKYLDQPLTELILLCKDAIKRNYLEIDKKWKSENCFGNMYDQNEIKYSWKSDYKFYPDDDKYGNYFYFIKECYIGHPINK